MRDESLRNTMRINLLKDQLRKQENQNFMFAKEILTIRNKI